jgi:hypothetical protein
MAIVIFKLIHGKEWLWKDGNIKDHSPKLKKDFLARDCPWDSLFCTCVLSLKIEKMPLSSCGLNCCGGWDCGIGRGTSRCSFFLK